MEAKELRIGNYVTDRGGKTLRIDWFERDNVCQEITSVNGLSLHPLTERFEFCNPIELTESILLCSHFDFNSNRRSYCKGWIEIEEGLFAKYKGNMVGKIKYLHQLQNLYFALTGEELKIEL